MVLQLSNLSSLHDLQGNCGPSFLPCFVCITLGSCTLFLLACSCCFGQAKREVPSLDDDLMRLSLTGLFVCRADKVKQSDSDDETDRKRKRKGGSAAATQKRRR